MDADCNIHKCQLGQIGFFDMGTLIYQPWDPDVDIQWMATGQHHTVQGFPSPVSLLLAGRWGHCRGQNVLPATAPFPELAGVVH